MLTPNWGVWKATAHSEEGVEQLLAPNEECRQFYQTWPQSENGVALGLWILMIAVSDGPCERDRLIAINYRVRMYLGC